MIKKFICWLWGHKTVIEVATGEMFDTYDRLTMQPIKAHYMALKQLPFCTRCGKDVK